MLNLSTENKLGNNIEKERVPYTVKIPVLKLTPAGVNTGPISNGVNLTPFWSYFNTFRCFSSPVGDISTPKSVEITPKWC